MNAEPQRHVVVFDVNVWLDLARLMGAGSFDWDALTALLIEHQAESVPSALTSGLDSARAIATCRDGEFAGGEPLEVWTSSHLDDVLIHKLTLPERADRDEDRGFGWTEDDALDFLHTGPYELVWEMTGGTTAGPVEVAEASPPLDHEDGKVYWTALQAGDGDVSRYLLTNDVSFRRANLPGNVVRLFPWEWVHLVRRSKQHAALSKMRPPV